MTTDVWSYGGKRVVIAGCYSGMGEATARELVRLGAEVHGVDIKRSPVDLASFREADLRDTAQIDAALEAIGGPLRLLQGRVHVAEGCEVGPHVPPSLRQAGSAFRELKEAHHFEYVIPNHDREDGDNWQAFYYHSEKRAERSWRWRPCCRAKTRRRAMGGGLPALSRAMIACSSPGRQARLGIDLHG
jgi:hypothetical protein